MEEMNNHNDEDISLENKDEVGKTSTEEIKESNENIEETKESDVKGIVEETKTLIEKHGRISNIIDTIGYKEILTYLDGEATLEEALDKLRQHTRNYAKRLLTWFRKNPNLKINC